MLTEAITSHANIGVRCIEGSRKEAEGFRLYRFISKAAAIVHTRNTLGNLSQRCNEHADSELRRSQREALMSRNSELGSDQLC